MNCTLNPVSENPSFSVRQHGNRFHLHYLLLGCAAIIALIWIWLSVFSSGNIRFDSDRMIYERSVVLAQYRNEGRLVLAFLLEYLFPSVWNPVLYGGVFLAVFLMNGYVLTIFLVRFTERKWHSLLYGLFFLLYGTSPIWAFQFYFTLQVPVIALGMLLCVLLAAWDVSGHTNQVSIFHRTVLEFFSLCFCTILMLIYQALIIYYITVIIIFLFCRLFHGSAISWKSAISWILRLVLSVLLYVFIARSARNGDSEYLMNQIQWNRLPVLTCLKDIVVEYGKILFMVHSGHFSLYLPGLVLMIILLNSKFRNHEYGKHEKTMLVLSATALVVLPMAISVMEGSRPVPRTQFSLQAVSAFFLVCFMAESGKAYRSLLICSCFIVLLQSALVIRLTITDNQRNRLDLDMRDQIAADVKAMDAEDKSLIFIGSGQFDDRSVFFEKTDVFGLSFGEWSYAPDQPASATTGAIRLMNTGALKMQALTDPTMISEAVCIAESMPVFPSDGYMKVTDDYCVIKLSNP